MTGHVRRRFQPARASTSWRRPQPHAPNRYGVPRISRLVALAHHFAALVARGQVASLADLSRVARVTRARITQIMDLLLLAPDIQEELLFLERSQHGRDPVTLRTMRYVCQAPAWGEQRDRWQELIEGLT